MSGLKPSVPDTIALSSAVQSRFLDLCEAYLRIRGVELSPPPSLDADMLRWRTMAVRFKKGDFRNSEGELKALRTIAQWTLDENSELRNQPKVSVDWSKGNG